MAHPYAKHAQDKVGKSRAKEIARQSGGAVDRVSAQMGAMGGGLARAGMDQVMREYNRPMKRATTAAEDVDSAVARQAASDRRSRTGRD